MPSADVPAVAPTAAAVEPTAPAAAPYVGTLRLPGGGYWGHPSPFGFNRGPGYVRTSLVFDTLVWRDAGGETIPWLATGWSLSSDELTPSRNRLPLVNRPAGRFLLLGDDARGASVDCARLPPGTVHRRQGCENRQEWCLDITGTGISNK